MTDLNDTMKTRFSNSKLYKRILSENNIYSAIYSMESYVLEKGLLDVESPVSGEEGRIIAENDLELYYALSDKFNVDLIGKVISVCQTRLARLFTNQEDLFEVTVYFRLKKVEGDKLKFRPLHIARLTDLICMVSILNCLMFEDSEERHLSDLSKLIPCNFYANNPSLDIQYLFQRWQTKYKEYTDTTIEHCRNYQKNHQYLTEVCLDIENFFPSVSPNLVYNYIIGKLSTIYDGEDKDALRCAVAKLLYFKLSEKNIEPWLDEYYPGGVDLPDKGLYMNCGIAQGLPQSYFFGNLCMIEVAGIMMKEECFNGDAYFYVDDSVIYVKARLEDEEFEKRINSLNDRLKDYCINNQAPESGLREILPPKYLDFQKRLSYVIKFHGKEKSTYHKIDEAENYLGGFENIARETSMSSALLLSLDEIDDKVSFNKTNAIIDVINKEISKIESNDRLKQTDASKLNRLRRYRRFFLNRNRLLKLKTEGGPKKVNREDFKDSLSLAKKKLGDWLDQRDNDALREEYRLLIKMETLDKAEEIAQLVDQFELDCIKEYSIGKDRHSYLYYSKDARCSVEMKHMRKDSYRSLEAWVKENYKGLEDTSLNDQFDNGEVFLGIKDGPDKIPGMVEILDKGFKGKGYTVFVAKNSSEFQRMILNAYFSVVTGIQPSDAKTFVKFTYRRLYYYELRILAWLRNREFNLDRFRAFVKTLEKKDISDRMGIDMALLEVLNIFITLVHDPEKVDHLILTHRITKGLWQNGSKFLNAYTLHNEEHAVTLIKKAVQIVRTIDYFNIKSADYYILFMACYLHDISMVANPDLYSIIESDKKWDALVSGLIPNMNSTVQSFYKPDEDCKDISWLIEPGQFLIKVFNEVYGYFEDTLRKNHPKDSAKFIRDKADSLFSYMDAAFASFVAKVSESHGYDAVEVYWMKSNAAGDTISLKYLMILLRMADLFDVAYDRVNYYLLKQQLNQMSPASKFHWISHLITNRIELSADYSVDEKKELYDKPVTETLNVNLFLNFKNLTAISVGLRCKNCRYKSAKDHLCIEINDRTTGETQCKKKKCPFLCRWMTIKHEWLIRELSTLSDYLASANNSMIQTKIRLNIYYSDQPNLNKEMAKAVQDYLATLSP